MHFKNLFHSYFQKDLLLLLMLGVSSGVPFLLILSTLSYWLNELNFSKTQVSLFMVVSLPYSLKMLWAPYLERYTPPLFFKKLGHKKGWGVLSQIFLFLCIIVMSVFSPEKTPLISFQCCLLICFFSATQDIVIDGLRIDRFSGQASGLAASFSGIGFHIGKLASGCGTLYLADCFNWHYAYAAMSLAILPGIVAMLFFPSVDKKIRVQKNMSPLRASLNNLFCYKNIKLFILLIVFFKIADAILQGTTATFLYELGLSKLEFATLTKMYGTFWVIVGNFLGGVIVELLGVYPAAFMSVMLQVFSCFLFALQAYVGNESFVLGISIGFENFSSGVMLSSLIAIISNYVKKPFAMSHYTLLYAVGSLSRVLFSSMSGFFADKMGWFMFYFSVGLFILPTFYIILRLQKIESEKTYEKN